MLAYGGSAYGYANNPDFSHIGDERFWQKVIDAFYDKYRGIASWHKKIKQEVVMTGKLTTPTGRTYKYKPDFRGQWPDTTIKNYAIQGLGADMMAIARISAFNRIKKLNYGSKALWISTVHDSLMLDVDNDLELIYNVCCVLEDVFTDLPLNFEKLFGVKFNVPMAGECEYGWNWKEMQGFNKQNGKQQIKQFLIDGIK